jgi:hypothetical protein
MTSPSASIAQLVLAAAEVNQLVAAADVNSIWQYGQPNEGASDEELQQIQRSYDIGPEYIELLRVANGWPGFYHDVDLLSIHDLEGGELLDRAWMLAESADNGSSGMLALNKFTHIPIAVSANDIDVFLLNLQRGDIRWIAGQEVESFVSVDSFLREMTEYNRQTLEDLRVDPWIGAG